MPGIRRASLLVACLSLSSSAAFADDPYASYRIPDHHWLSWSSSLSGSGSHQRVQAPQFGLGNGGNMAAAGGSAFSTGYDSDALVQRYDLIVALAGARSYSSQQNPQVPISTDQIRRDRNANERVSGSAFVAAFPWRAPLGFSASLAPVLTLDQSWTSSSVLSRFPPRLELSSSDATSGRYAASVVLGLGVGFGRVRDATPVYQVQLLEERLRAIGTLARELSPEAREKLAALYTIEGRVAFAHDRPTKYFWQELERVLREDGALGDGGLDAYSVQRLLEPLAIRGSAARARGFSVGPQVQFLTQRSHTSQGSEASRALFQDDTLVASSDFRSPRVRTNRRRDFVLSGFAVEYHRPVGMRWQTDAFTRALLTESGERLSLATAAAVSWFVADRWVVATGLSHSADSRGHRFERKLDDWRFDYSASVDYFLEDAWSLKLATDLRQSRDPAYSRSESYSIGLSYRLAGLLRAPGLVETMHLSPPTH